MRFLFALILLLSVSASAFSQEFADGTVIVWENGNFLGVMQRQTGSNFTHAGIILYEGTQGWVYEASAPDVHRWTVEQYKQRVEHERKSIPKLHIHFLPPSRPYTAAELASMKKYANECLGVPFSIQSYLKGRKLSTMHCCEYVGNILYSSGRYKTRGPKENPKTIFDGASKL